MNKLLLLSLSFLLLFSFSAYSFEKSKPLEVHVFEKSKPIKKIVIKPSIPVHNYESRSTGCSVIIYIDSLNKENKQIDC